MLHLYDQSMTSIRDMLLSAASKQVRGGLREGSHCGPSTGSNAEHQHADQCVEIYVLYVVQVLEDPDRICELHLGWKVTNTPVVLDNEGLATLGDVLKATA
jgi:hypothetical protein